MTGKLRDVRRARDKGAVVGELAENVSAWADCDPYDGLVPDNEAGERLRDYEKEERRERGQPWAVEQKRLNDSLR